MAPSRGPRGYTAIAVPLRRDIADGVFATGDSLHTEAQLYEFFSASRGPIRQAMSTLHDSSAPARGVVRW